jgi:hypothetical protein
MIINSSRQNFKHTRQQGETDTEGLLSFTSFLWICRRSVCRCTRVKVVCRRLELTGTNLVLWRLSIWLMATHATSKNLSVDLRATATLPIRWKLEKLPGIAIWPIQRGVAEPADAT